MPDLNLIDEGGIEESTTPSAPMPSKRGSSGGGSLNKILLTVLVLLIIGTALFYSYKKGKFPFKKKATAAVVQEETFPDASPIASNQNTEQVVQPQDTARVPLLETPMVDNKSKSPDAKATTTETAKQTMADTKSMQKLTDMQGNYTVQVSALREKKQAEEIVGRLEDAGYPAFVETIPMKGVNWYTVRIGHYPSRHDAKKAVEDFALELRSNYWIDRIHTK
jgi:cell division septation protein DedD